MEAADTAADERLAAFRRDFPALTDGAYLNTAQHGLVSMTSRRAADHYLDRLQAGATEADFAGDVVQAREGLARLIACDPEELALTRNISSGLNLIMGGYPWVSGDNLVICPDIEHPTVVWAAAALQRRGVAVRALRAKHGRFPVMDAIANMDDRTRMVAVSSVSYIHGTATDLEQLGAACRARHVLLLVDAAQSVGVSVISCRQTPIDALVANTHKGLLGVAGLGFLYCSRPWIERIQPVMVGAESVRGTSPSSPASVPADWAWTDTARRFEVGHANSLAAAVTAAALRQIDEVGLNLVSRRVARLRRLLYEELQRLGHALSGDVDEKSGIVSADPGAQPAGAVVERLRERHVYAAERVGRVRLSLHAYNTEEQVHMAVEAFDAIVRPK